jgi:hypothetical protein
MRQGQKECKFLALTDGSTKDNGFQRILNLFSKSSAEP